MRQKSYGPAAEAFEATLVRDRTQPVRSREWITSATNAAQLQIYFLRDGAPAISYLPDYLPFTEGEFGDDPLRYGFIQSLLAEAHLLEGNPTQAERAAAAALPHLASDKSYRDGWYYSEAYQAYLGGGECATYTQRGFKAFFPDARKAPTPISLDFKIDAAKFGYDDIDDLMSDRKNRIRVMSKLEATKALGFDLDFGTVARSTPLQDADFCGSCKLKMRKGVELFFNYMPGTPIGDGVLSGFKDGNHEAAVFYDIKPLD